MVVCILSNVVQIIVLATYSIESVSKAKDTRIDAIVPARMHF